MYNLSVLYFGCCAGLGLAAYLQLSSGNIAAAIASLIIAAVAVAAGVITWPQE